MTLKLMYITNNAEVARIAEASGVDWIFIDLEQIGKAQRQGHLDTVMSKHSIDDIREIKKILTKSKLLVRTNPIHENSKQEIKEVVKNGADILMLPYYKTIEEVEKFIEYSGKEVQKCLLLETPEAVEILNKTLNIQGIDFIHIGLNDLHLGYKMKFMFELLADGTVEKIAEKIKMKGIPFGFGGIARVGQGTLPAEKIITEHFRLGSTMVILSRSFCNLSKISDLKEIENTFSSGVKDIRSFEDMLKYKPVEFYDGNRKELVNIVKMIVEKVGG